MSSAPNRERPRADDIAVCVLDDGSIEVTFSTFKDNAGNETGEIQITSISTTAAEELKRLLTEAIDWLRRPLPD